MRKVTIVQVNNNIQANRKKVNAELHAARANNPRVKRNRPRSEDERRALTQITRASVERAKREGKMKMIGERKMYYDASE